MEAITAATLIHRIVWDFIQTQPLDIAALIASITAIAVAIITARGAAKQEKIEELENELRDYKKKLDKQGERIADLEKENIALKDENMRLRVKIRNLQDQLDEYRNGH